MRRKRLTVCFMDFCCNKINSAWVSFFFFSFFTFSPFVLLILPCWQPHRESTTIIKVSTTMPKTEAQLNVGNRLIDRGIKEACSKEDSY